jgi:hypothetical protein
LPFATCQPCFLSCIRASLLSFSSGLSSFRTTHLSRFPIGARPTETRGLASVGRVCSACRRAQNQICLAVRNITPPHDMFSPVTLVLVL